MKNKSLSKQLLGGVASFLAAVVFLITFVDSKYVPSWRDIFGIYGTYDKEADIISFVDVGQGDCVLIQSNGRFALIDAGEADNDIARVLKRKGIKGFDAVILSHWHSDHAKGLYEILDAFKVENAVFPDVSKNDEDAIKLSENVTKLCAESGVNVHNAVQGMAVNIGDIELTVLLADNQSTEENNRSLIIMAECRGNKFLFTGDAEAKLEEKLVKSGINIDCDVLKVAHHGSDASTSNEFLKLCTPEYAVISVGSNNSYGHPNRDALNRLYSFNAQIYRTDYDGHIDFTLSDEGIVVSTQY